jgi:hypothetical protein
MEATGPLLQHLVLVDLTQMAQKVCFRVFLKNHDLICLSTLLYPKVEHDFTEDLVWQANSPSEQPEYDAVEPGKWIC